jgi:phospholipid/cholesterol/gamma-HCH transport system substrate-binding protein
METRANYVAVGAFVLVLLIGAAGILLWLVGNQFSEVVAYYEISFTGSVSGLDKDSQVRYNGVPVGKVSELDIDQLNPNHIRVIAALDPAVVIRSDALATLSVPLVTGGASIDIIGGTNGAPPFPHRTEPPFPLIQAQSGSGFQALLAQAPDIEARAIAIEDQVLDILSDKNKQAITDTLENVRKVTGTLADHSDDIATILTNTVALTGDADETIKSATDLIHQAGGVMTHANAVVADVDTAIHDADTLVVNANGTVGDIRPGVRDFSQRGLNGLEDLINNTNAVVIKIGRVVDELERNPQRFLFGDKNQGYQPK